MERLSRNVNRQRSMLSDNVLAGRVHRERNSLCLVPAIIQPVFDTSYIYTISPTPFRKVEGNAVNCYKAYSQRAIKYLLLLCRPAAIFGCVVAIIVDSVKSVLGARFCAHVSKKVLEAISPQPALTYLNSTTPIPVEVAISRGKASVFHGSIGITLSPINRVQTTPIVGRFYPKYLRHICLHFTTLPLLCRGWK